MSNIFSYVFTLCYGNSKSLVLATARSHEYTDAASPKLNLAEVEAKAVQLTVNCIRSPGTLAKRMGGGTEMESTCTPVSTRVVLALELRNLQAAVKE
jgi:hypothetical protein